MKRLLSLILILAMCFSLAACGGASDAGDSSSFGNKSMAEEPKDEPVTITIPGGLFEEDELEELIGNESSGNYESLTVNEDGSVTVVMTQEQHKAILSSLGEELRAEVESSFPDEDLPSIKAVQFSEDFTTATLTVDYAAYDSSFDSFYELAVIIFGSLYQTFAGVAEDDIAITISIVDEETGTVERTSQYPEDYESDDGGDFDLPEFSDEEAVRTEQAGDLGDYSVEIKGAKKVQDYQGNPAIQITYSWTNNSEETTSPFATILETAFQDGVEMDLAIVDFETSDGMKEVRPGATIDVDAVFELTSDSVVEFELSEWLSFDNEIVYMNFDPTELE